MNHYRVWAIDKAMRSVVVRSTSEEAAITLAKKLIQSGSWDDRVEQDAGQVCEWEIISADAITK